MNSKGLITCMVCGALIGSGEHMKHVHVSGPLVPMAMWGPTYAVTTGTAVTMNVPGVKP
jgi:hypothetical protein